MRSTGGGGEAEDQAGGRGQGGRRRQRTRREEGEAGGAAAGGGGRTRGAAAHGANAFGARRSSSRRRGRTGGGGDGRGEEEEDRRRGRRTAGKHAPKAVTLKAAEQVVEDRPAVVLRRRQELEADEAAATHHRRTALPTRVLVDRVGGEWSGRVGGVDGQVAHVANALGARRITLEAAQRRSGEPHGVSTAAEYIVAKDGTIVLARHLQQEVMDRIYSNWKQTEQGREFADLARKKVDAAAREKAQRAQRIAQQRGRRPARTLYHGRGAGASTPDHVVGTENQFDRELRNNYFRNYCDKAYGGKLWLQFLIALEDIPDDIVTRVNALAIYRTKEKRGEHSAATVPDATPGNNFLCREDRASTPVPDDYVAAKTRRHKAYCRVRMLEEWQKVGWKYVSQQTMDFARRQLEDADAASVASRNKFKNYWGQWQNDFESYKTSQFEMVLRSFLADCHDFSDEMISTIVDKRSPQGSASTPALTQGSAQGGKGGGQGGGQGGKGGGQGGGRGGKGGDRGGGKKRKAGKGDKGGGLGGGQDDGGKKRKIGGSFHRVGPPATI